MMLKAFYDWKIRPAITKSYKKQEKREAEEEERKKREKQEKINNLNRIWKNDREALQSMRQPLMEFNAMNRYHIPHQATRCFELASQIEERAEKIQRPEFQQIKQKLLEYAGRKNQIDQNTILKQLMNLFQRQIEPDKYEPFVLWKEIEETLKATSTPPFSEENIRPK